MRMPGKYPNDLAHFVRMSGLRPAELARRAQTSRTQISDLMLGVRQLTRPWAERLAPHLGVSWLTLMAGREKVSLAESEVIDIAPPSNMTDTTMADPDEAFAQIQEAVAELLKAEQLPHAQSDIARVSRIVEREMIALGRMRDFANGLELTLSEVASRLKRKWAEALSRR